MIELNLEQKRKKKEQRKLMKSQKKAAPQKEYVVSVCDKKP